MQRHVIGLALILVFATAAYAGEPEMGQLNFNVGGGINMPNDEEAENGYVLGGGVGYHLTPNLVLGGELSYFGYRKGEVSTPQGDITMSQHFIEYGGAAKFFLGTGKASPYFKGFAGRFNYGFDISGGGVAIGDNYTDMQYGGGLGMVVRGAEESNLYFEALYHNLNVEEDTAEIFTVTMGMDINFSP
jgi:opacity protein-like surface antigen